MAQWCLYVSVLLLLLCSDVTSQKREKKQKAPSALARGWGDNIDWIENYEDGLITMQARNKPLMVIHHLKECPYCDELKKAFIEDTDIQKMAKKDFIMLNVMEETGDPNMAPDGFYVPRVLFVDPSKTVRADITGKYDNRKYAYQPEDIDLLKENMEKAKILLKSEL